MFMACNKYLTCYLQGKTIDEFLHEGSTVKFSCHEFDESGQDQCGYFVTTAWIQDDNLRSPNTGTDTKGFLGINNACGTVSEVSRRQGVITYVDANGGYYFMQLRKNLLEYDVICYSILKV
jgi:hypothetical protein